MAAAPNSRETFKQYCLRRLGAPVVQVNVEDDQVDDRINDAIQFWQDYHSEGTEKLYYKYQIQAADITNKYITLPSNIIGAISIFPIGGALVSGNFFDVRYQMALNDLYDLTAVELAPYVMTMQYFQLIEELIVGNQPVRYNRHNNVLHIDMNWNRVTAGEWLVIEAYGVLDPEAVTDAWNDRWLKQYATALIKRQWGENLTKFVGVKLPGGAMFNGERILNDAQAEIEKLEEEMIFKYSGPLEFYSG